jgi:hypothetical protein
MPLFLFLKINNYEYNSTVAANPPSKACPIASNSHSEPLL